MNAKRAALIVLFAFPAASNAEDKAAAPAPPTTAPKIQMNELEKQFERTMTGATLVGRSTVDGKDEKAPPPPDRYTIVKATKIGDDLWLLTARIGDGKLPIPLPVPVKWAGDTPVISVTKLKVPTMGIYTARVMIYADHYAGTWDAGDHGGHMWGMIERAAEKRGQESGIRDRPKR